VLPPLSDGLDGELLPGGGICGDGADGVFVSELPGVPLAPGSVVPLAPGAVVPGVVALGVPGVAAVPGVAVVPGAVVSGVVAPPDDPIPPVVPGVLDPAPIPSSATRRQPETGVRVIAADARACTSICAT
jgi:hypothetical protein